MTINIADNSPRISYTVAQGATQTSFAVPFEFFDNADLNVYIDGTLKTITTHYTVSGGDGSTGTVSMSVTGGTGGSTVVITRDIELERTTDFPVSGAFNIVALNTELDRLVAIAADLNDLASRSLQLSDSDTSATLTLPIAADRINKVLAFNSTGNTLVTQELGTFKGNWAASTSYVERDLVKDTTTNNVFIVNAAHTSSGSQPLTTNTNSSKYDKIIDVSSPAGDLTVGDDLTLASDAAVLGFGVDTDVTLTHVADTGLLLNSTRQLQFNDASQYINAPNATTLDINATDEIELNATLIDVNGNLEVSGTITLGSGAVISEAELEALDDVTAGTVAASKAVIVDSNKDIASFRNLTATGAITGGSFVIGSADINENDLEAIDGVTAGTVAASKAVVVDTNKDISSFRNLTASGTVTYGSLSDGSITVTAFVDEDNMSSNSATLVPTQQSVKAYVDAQVATADTWAEVLANGNTTGSTDAVISSGQKLTTNTIDETTSGSGVTIDSVVLKDNIVTASAITLTSGGAFRSTVDDGSVALSGGNNSNTGSNIILYGSSHASLPNDIKIRRSGVDFALFDGATGDISFYEDTGTTAKFFWDASAESLGIGTSSPPNRLSVKQSGNTSAASFGVVSINSANDTYIGMGYDSSSDTNRISSSYSSSGAYKPIAFLTSDTERMRIANSGHVGINFSDPASTGSRLVVQGDAGSNTVFVKGNTGSGTSWGLGVNAGSTSADASFRVYDKDGTNSYLYVRGDGKIGIGTASPSRPLTLTDATSDGTGGFKIESYLPTLEMDDISGGGTSFILQHDGTNTLFKHDTTERMRIDSSGNVGIGTSSTDGKLKISATSGGANAAELTLYGNNGPAYGYGNVVRSKIASQSAGDAFGANLLFYTNDSSNAYQERMRIDSSGNLLVGKTSAGYATDGFEARASGYASVSDSGSTPFLVNRNTDDGNLISFYKSGATVGSIGSQGGLYCYMGSPSNTDAYTAWADGVFKPSTSTGTNNDNAMDLGNVSSRWDDIYATNGTIQTSDRNEKQDIAELTDAEQKVAVAAKGLLRKFRWKAKVAEKGDKARTHFGIIAQDLQAAFAAEGLDAGDYGMFISSTWTEETGEERTRMGVRYSELLAFIIAAI